ncbi:MAG TPA: TIGR00725 family protein [Acidimicrobiales bacterium]|nr:TIGR00725 family protein [Acidimicrobiales bacterium]
MELQVAVVGGSEPTTDEAALAEDIGRALAEKGAVVVCGGLGGVMAAACRGAKSAGGLTVGLLPGRHPGDANPWVDIAIPTGLGETRNALVVAAASAVVAVGGEYGTLSEIALALRAGKPVVGVGTWTLTRPGGDPDSGIVPADDALSAAKIAVTLATEAQP